MLHWRPSSTNTTKTAREVRPQPSDTPNGDHGYVRHPFLIVLDIPQVGCSRERSCYISCLGVSKSKKEAIRTVLQPTSCTFPSYPHRSSIRSEDFWHLTVVPQYRTKHAELDYTQLEPMFSCVLTSSGLALGNVGH